MIHRAHFGSLERFIAILLENTSGNLPLWLTPNQFIILPISQKHEKYCENVLNLLENNEIRGLVDNRNETIGKKIRDAELKKLPFMIIVGEKEKKEKLISVRRHGGNEDGLMKVEDFIDIINSSIKI